MLALPISILASALCAQSLDQSPLHSVMGKVQGLVEECVGAGTWLSYPLYKPACTNIGDSDRVVCSGKFDYNV